MLHRAGVLAEAGLDCARCHEDEKRRRFNDSPGTSQKERRGCGVSPMVRGRPWNAEGWLDANPTLDAKRAPYRLANLGRVARDGWLWPCCPRYFLEFADDGALSVALEAVEAMEWKQDGALGSLVEGALPSGMVDLIQWAERHEERLENMREEERAKELETQAKKMRGRGR